MCVFICFLLQEVDEDLHHKWYKRMYNTLHKVHQDGKRTYIMITIDKCPSPQQKPCPLYTVPILIANLCSLFR